MTRYGQFALCNSSTDTSYGSDPAEPAISVDKLKRLCQEYFSWVIKHTLSLFILPTGVQ